MPNITKDTSANLEDHKISSRMSVPVSKNGESECEEKCFGRGILTESGALPPKPARKRNAMSCPFV
jgi:hypothetical protein